LTLRTFGGGSVAASPPGPYTAETAVTLTASPALGWSFSSWSGDLTGYRVPATLLVDRDSSVTASFDETAYHGVTGDNRPVLEPTFPAACNVVLARQSAATLDQSLFDTSSLQAAIDGCPVGQAVELSATDGYDAFLTQPITLKAGVTLLIDAEVTLFGSSDRADYTCTRASCTGLIQAAPTATPSPSSAIMGYGTIDGQGASFWGTDPRPRLIVAGDTSTHASADNFTLYKITLQNSPSFNVYAFSNGLTVWGVKVRNPGDSPNTDGIDPSGSTNVTIRDSYISSGDDHIAIKAGIAPVENVTIAHNHLYYGHGLSIGSETNAGVENVLATDNVIDQDGCTDCTSANDIRIKSDASRGGEVHGVLYQDTCIRNATRRAHAVVLTPFYTTATGNQIPFFHDISFHNVHMVDSAGVSTFQGFDMHHVLETSMDNVVWSGVDPYDFTALYTSNAAFLLGPGPVSFTPDLVNVAQSDANVSVIKEIRTAAPAFDCTGRFVYMAAELFTSTASVAAGSAATLTSVLQPAIYGARAPSGTIELREGTRVVANAAIAGRLTPLTISDITPGTHIYTARYSGDDTYVPLRFGEVSVAGE
jgi:polygalacturonase